MAGRASKGTKQANGRMSLADKMAKFNREKRSTGVDWGQVNQTSLVTALHTLLGQDVAVMIAPTAGGRGVMVKVYEDGEAASEYLMSASDLNAHLETLIDAFQSSSEDVRQLFPVPRAAVAGD